MPMSADAIERLRQQAEAAKARTAGGGVDPRYVQLSGKNAAVSPGGTLLTRLAPRWDYAQAMRMNPKTRQIEPNPAYQGGEFTVEALEHWLDNVLTGKRAKCWCRQMLGPEERCPACEGAEMYLKSAADADRKLGKDLGASKVHLFNAVLRKDMYGEDGKPRFRILVTSDWIFQQIVDILTGGGEAAMQRPDLDDPYKGWDLALKRPTVAGGGERWMVQCAPSPTPLVPPEDRERWRGWPTMLHDLEAEVAPDKIKSFAEMYRMLWGTDADPADAGAGGSPEAAAEEPAAAGGWWEGEAAAPVGEEVEIALPEEPAPQPRRPPARPTAPPLRPGKTPRR